MTQHKLRMMFAAIVLFLLSTAGMADTIRPSKAQELLAVADCYAQDLVSDNLAAFSLEGRSFLVVSFNNRFCIKEMMTEMVGAVFRFRSNTFSFQASHFGYVRYGELMLNGGYAHSLGRHIGMALRFHYLMTHASEYPNVHSVTFDLSMYARIGKSFGLGFSIYNPALLKYGVVGKQPIPTRIVCDLQYTISRNLLVYGQLRTELRSCWETELGILCRVKVLHFCLAAAFPQPLLSAKVTLQYHRFLFGTDCTYRLRVGPIMGANLTYLL